MRIFPGKRDQTSHVLYIPINEFESNLVIYGFEVDLQYCFKQGRIKVRLIDYSGAT